MMRQRQLPSQIYSKKHVSMPMDSFAGYMDHSNPSQTYHHMLLLYMPNNHAIKEQGPLVISHMPYTYVPITVTSNLWIIPSNPQIQGSTMTII